MLFHGSYTALLTPFKDNKVDFDAYRKLIDFQIDNGTHGLVPVCLLYTSDAADEL